MKHKTPVALFVYNRPDLTAQVLMAIESYKPGLLLIISDGPKSMSDDHVAVEEVRRLCKSVNWSCEVRYQLRKTNFGCRDSITQGLSWIFTQVDEAIILEDDCLPDTSFFPFCATLLDKYRADHRIFTIGGFRAEDIEQTNGCSYYYSKYPCTWGWATWRRAYQDFDPNLTLWSEDKKIAWLTKYLTNPVYAHYWAYMLTRARNGSNDWDYAWAYHCWLNNAVSIRSNVNLIQNTGFGTTATHTKDTKHPFGKKSSATCTFPISHPSEIKTIPRLEDLLEDLLYSGIRRRQLQLLYREIQSAREKLRS